ncbi:uncharacterized protein LOC6563862 [Drosophila grimshawi]|uniref:GH19332 n=1 Tax=Drosophila grimshawi TaxID=7222 RepID=B4JFJ4_DROGR|nr:uncharacterized protein LOC6563862 [Drosophila grimshawi]EDV93475.1 GH19332 [Drosophila grimshawi]
MCWPLIKVATWLTLSLLAFDLCGANVVFHFSLDFHVKEPPNSSDPINKTIIVENNQVSLQDNEPGSSTTAPSAWIEEDQYNMDAVQLLEETTRAVKQLNVELSPLVGRSNQLAAVLKQTLRYVNDVDATLENGHFAQHVDQLRKYPLLIDNLRLGGVRTLEFVLLKLAMEKYKLLEKQQTVADYLQRADAAWSRFKNTQVVIIEQS